MKWLVLMILLSSCATAKYDHQVQVRLINIDSRKHNKCELTFLAGKDTIYYRYKGSMRFIPGDFYSIRYNQKERGKWLVSDIRHNE